MGDPDTFGGPGHLRPEPERALELAVRLREGEDGGGRPSGFDRGQQCPGEVTGGVPVVCQLDRGGHHLVAGERGVLLEDPRDRAVQPGQIGRLLVGVDRLPDERMPEGVGLAPRVGDEEATGDRLSEGTEHGPLG